MAEKVKVELPDHDYYEAEVACRNACPVKTDARGYLLATVAGSPRLSGELARFALNIRSFRRHLFRQLSSDGQSGRTLVATRLAALLD